MVRPHLRDRVGQECAHAICLTLLVSDLMRLVDNQLTCSVGLFEAGHFPAVMYVCSSYYKPHELARRNTIIQVFTQVGPFFSGFLM